MGLCTYRRAHLVASNLRETCGFPAYTFLKMRLAGGHFQGEYFSPYRGHFHLPACYTVFDET